MPLNVFVAHPYKTIPIDDYRNAFAELKKDLGAIKFVFADEEITNQHILDKIEKMIVDSDVSLFDVTTWNPNVALELGLAMGLKKDYYILFDPTKEDSEVPSDIRGRERIQYESLSKLRSLLAIALRKHMGATSSTSEFYEETKRRILDFLESNPSSKVGEVAQGIDENINIVKPIIAELKDEGSVAMQGVKKGAKYSLPAA
ncbi:MAG: hypothetical protein AAF366_22160 [Pseudomonadota bacterium]